MFNPGETIRKTADVFLSLKKKTFFAPAQNEFQGNFQRSGRITGEEETDERYSCGWNTLFDS